MIARISILLLVVTLLPDLYIYKHYVRSRLGIRPWQLLMWWLPTSIVLAFTAAYSMMSNFAPDNIDVFNAYLFALGLIVVSKLLFTLFSLGGRLVRRLTHGRANWGNYAGLVVVLGWLYVLFTGSIIGPERLRVKRVTLEFDSLPKAFDGFSIAHISDLHLGTMRPDLSNRLVAEINELHPDIVAFTGDIQNMRPSELPPHAAALSQLRAADGVFSILGNHDYTEYVHNLSDAEKRHNEHLTQQFERSVGWHLLMNERAVLRRGADSLIVAGTENDGLPPFPEKSDYKSALHGIQPSAFVVMLQHDPSAWHRHILQLNNVWLTLSGHTHGGQMSLFGIRPTQLTGREDAGLYRDGARYMYVSTGVGGFLHFRFHMDPEIVLITLKCKQQ